jgi:HEAT repeat protein
LDIFSKAQKQGITACISLGKRRNVAECALIFMSWWIAQQLKSKNPQTRRDAVEKLARESSSSAIQLLVSGLKDTETEVREAAAKSLGRMRDPKAIAALIEALQHDPSGAVREATVSSLRQIGDLEAVDALVGCLKDPQGGVRWQVAKTLERFGWQPRTDQERLLRAVALGDYFHAAQLGEMAIDALVKCLNDETCRNRRGIVEALGYIGGERVINVLLKALSNTDAPVRIAAIDALKETHDPRSVPALIKCLKDHDPGMRAGAAAALGSFDRSGLTALLEVLKDPHWAVRKAAVEAIGSVKESSMVERLYPLLKDVDHDVREAACDALGKIREQRAVTNLVLTLIDSQTSVRTCAAVALRDIESNWDKLQEAKAALPQLREALKDREYWVRQAAREAIQRIENAEDSPLERVGSVDEKVGAALNVLAWLVQHAHRDLRQAATEALGRFGNPQLAHLLQPRLHDEDPWVREAGAEALQSLGVEPGGVGVAA